MSHTPEDATAVFTDGSSEPRGTAGTSLNGLSEKMSSTPGKYASIFQAGT